MARCEARIVGDQCTDMLLLDKPPGAHVADIHRIDLFTGELGIFERKRSRLDKEVAEPASTIFHRRWYTRHR